MIKRIIIFKKYKTINFIYRNFIFILSDYSVKIEEKIYSVEFCSIYDGTFRSQPNQGSFLESGKASIYSGSQRDYATRKNEKVNAVYLSITSQYTTR